MVSTAVKSTQSATSKPDDLPEPTYDATYLELAIWRGLPLACLDGKLKAAASAAGVTPYAVGGSSVILAHEG